MRKNRESHGKSMSGIHKSVETRSRRLRRTVREWRRTRPFWAGVFTIASGAIISIIPLAHIDVMLYQGLAGIPSVLMGIFLIILGGITWVTPQQHVITGVLTTLVGLAALVLSNLGGFFVGSLLSFIGGALAFAWRPTPRRRRRSRRSTAASDERPSQPPPPSSPAPEYTGAIE